MNPKSSVALLINSRILVEIWLRKPTNQWNRKQITWTMLMKDWYIIQQEKIDDIITSPWASNYIHTWSIMIKERKSVTPHMQPTTESLITGLTVDERCWLWSSIASYTEEHFFPPILFEKLWPNENLVVFTLGGKYISGGSWIFPYTVVSLLQSQIRVQCYVLWKTENVQNRQHIFIFGFVEKP